MLGRLLLGRGTLPDDLRAQLTAEGLDQEEEGIRGTVTYRHHRAPRRRSNWRRQWIRAALAITDRRLLVAIRAARSSTSPGTIRASSRWRCRSATTTAC